MSDRRTWQTEADRLGNADPDHPTAWFERLWSAARRGEVTTPWDRTEPHPALASWARPADGPGRTAVVVGCGLGADAEHLARLGYTTTAFDISASAVAAAGARNPGSPVRYAVADLLDLPAAWAGAFDLVVEIYTVQAVSRDVREALVDGVRSLVAEGGTLLVVQAATEEPDDEGPPWPLTRAELELFATEGLTAVSVEEIVADGRRSWRAELRRRGRG
ncbi:methyltransferase domain-containing protein [Georgenia phoenicis]|uniref:class I SAM-dependent methyltransferase n=1 Tax=unclassified Georgenia TaxID=2626815 RepID=UPI0039AF814D